MDKKDKLAQAEREKKECLDKLNIIYREQQRLRQDLEAEGQAALEAKERELRKLQAQLQGVEHTHMAKVEALKQENKSNLEVIEEKIGLALRKKNEVIERVEGELKVKEIQVEKLRVMLEKQRRELL